MPRPALRALATVGVIAAVAVPATAFATPYSHDDARHDVMRQDETSTGEAFHRAPANKNADIKRMRAAYQTDDVRTTMVLRGIGHGFYAVNRIKSPDANYTAVLMRQHHHTTVGLTKGRGSKDITCDGIDVTVDRTKDKVTFTVPITCLGTPPSVQVGIGMIALDKKGHFFADDALRTRGVREGKLTLSPELAAPSVG